MNSDQIIDKILRNVPLTEAESDWWRMNKDKKDIQDQYELLEALKTPLAIENKSILKEQLKGFEKSRNKLEGQVRGGNNIFNLKIWGAIAASMLVLITAVFVFRNSSGTTTYDEYLEPYPSIVSPVLKGDQDSDEMLDIIMGHYQNQNYELVDDMMDNNIVSNDTLAFYHANALLMINKTTEAQVIFSRLQKTTNRFTLESQWYEALSLIKLKQLDLAQNKLQLIIQNSQHPYYDEARQLLKDIK